MFEELANVFPSSYSEIIKLKGVGPYTAAAIASICFEEAEPVVDGNVFRFASRYFGIKADISKSGSRKVFVQILKKEIPRQNPGAFNQAMMEFGATTCTPSPPCADCEFRLDCFAFKNNVQKSLPVKTGKIKVRDRHFNYVVIKNGDHLFLKERTEKDVWSGLFDFFLIEGNYDEESVLIEVTKKLHLSKPIVEEVSEPMLHILSHQKIYARFYLLVISDLDATFVCQNNSLKSYSVEEILNLPKPKLIVNYLQQAGFK